MAALSPPSQALVLLQKEFMLLDSLFPCVPAFTIQLPGTQKRDSRSGKKEGMEDVTFL